jgi:RNA polymerase sigma factor (sigma-70 family)
VTVSLSEDDRQELAKCFLGNAATLFGYACWLTRGDRQLADDLVQDAFHEAAARWRDMRAWSQERQACWLRGTVHNLAVTSFRRSALDRSKQEVIWERYRPRAADTHQEALSAIALQGCRMAIEHMPPRQQLVALLRWGENMSIGEIAKVLEVAEGTVSAHLATARKRLITEVGPLLPFDLDRPGREEGSGHGP